MTFDAALHPDGPSGVPGLLAAADAVRDRVLGFIVQCETCPQKAVVDTQPERGWVCPRCAAVVDFERPPVRDLCGKHTGIASNRCLLPEGHGGAHDCQTLQYVDTVETGHDIGGSSCAEAASMFPQHQKTKPCPHQAVRYGVCADCGQIPQYPWGAAIPAADDDYPIGKVRG